MDIHPRQQLLYVGAADPFGLELFGADLPVQQRDGHQIFEVVIRLLFGRRVVLVAVAATTGDVERTLEHLEGHRRDVGAAMACSSRSASVASMTTWPWISEQYCLR